jgi:hypothetical protein
VNVERLVDRFVEHVNNSEREELEADEVPPFLRDGESEWGVRWKIIRADNSAHVAALAERLPARLPPSFHYFVSNYSFPAFEVGELMLFANTGQRMRFELSERIFADPYMSPALLKAGFIQIGNPFFYNYDPVCFDTTSAKSEYPIVQLDHEVALQSGGIKVVKQIAPSFINFAMSIANGEPRT